MAKNAIIARSSSMAGHANVAPRTLDTTSVANP